jgi:hypothetical protein
MGESELESRFLAATTMGLTTPVGRQEEIVLLCKRWAAQLSVSEANS